VTRRSLRHPVRGDRRYLRPSHAARKAAARPARRSRPLMRPRRNLNVASLVASPEEQPSRPNVRLVVVGLFFLALLCVMILRLWSLQVIQAKSSAAAVVANQIRTVPVPAPRGVIVDRNERILVGNQVEQQIVLSRHEALVDPGIIAQVATLVGTTPGQVQQDLNSSQYSPYQGVPILTGANAVTVEYLAEHKSQYPGVSVQQTAERTYPQGGTTAPGVLGYVTNINLAELKANRARGYTDSSAFGQAGLEGEYEHYLAGTPGEDRISVNVLGNVVGTKRTRDPVEGDTVVTNIDLNLQNVAQTALANAISADRNTQDKTTGLYPAATDGAAVVMNVQTGAVLALASYPSYDLSDWVGGISPAQFASIESTGAENDYAISGEFPPGSTFKLATATAALQSGIISPGQYVDDSGKFTVPNCNGQNGNAGCVFNDDEDKAGGEVNLISALTQSDDYYFYNLGYLFYVEQSKYGATPIQNVAAQYGLGVPSGIDLPDEASGRVDSQAVRKALHKEDPVAFPYTTWYEGDNIEMAFGQGGTVVTPIEEAVAYATFANGGTRYEPEIAAAVVNPATDQVVKRFAPKVTGHVDLPPAIYQPILEGLEGVVSNAAGTAYATFQADADFSESQFTVAGKTGTGDTTSGNITRGDEEPDSWFVGFGPNPDPKYVVVVVIEHGGYGAQAAAPAVANIFNYLVANPIGPVELPTLKAQPTKKPLKANTPPPSAGSTTTTTTAPRAAPSTTAPPPAPTTTTTTSPPAATTTTTTTQPG
jgi:penicillin-binding protein 2